MSLSKSDHTCQMITVLRTREYCACLGFPLSSASHCSSGQGATLDDQLILRSSPAPTSV
uniref:Uncharacterized protein n=2 Tax=unclassified Kuttervirus TaxID=2770329 RepID=A0AAU8GL52_9CAUD